MIAADSSPECHDQTSTFIHSGLLAAPAGSIPEGREWIQCDLSLLDHRKRALRQRSCGVNRVFCSMKEQKRERYGYGYGKCVESHRMYYVNLTVSMVSRYETEKAMCVGMLSVTPRSSLVSRERSKTAVIVNIILIYAEASRVS